MDYNIADNEISEIDKNINRSLVRIQNSNGKLLQLASDSTRMLSVSLDTVNQMQGAGFFQRILNILPSSKKAAQINAMQENQFLQQSQINSIAQNYMGQQNQLNSLAVNQRQLADMQKYAWRTLQLLNEREMLTAEALITVKNNLVSLAVDQNDIKQAIRQMSDKVAIRLEKLENRISQIEASHTLEMWINNLQDDGYEKYPEIIRFLKVAKGFYLKKQKNYTVDELKSFRRALRNVGIDPKQEISLGEVIDKLIVALQSFDETEYLNTVTMEMQHGAVVSNNQLADMLPIPSFIILCQFPESKKQLEPAVEVLKDNMNISHQEALQRVMKQQISKNNGIDLDVKMAIADLGVELISCYSAIPDLTAKKTLFCSNCGTKVDAAFCPECGTKIE